jgi:hypothetical protein
MFGFRTWTQRAAGPTGGVVDDKWVRNVRESPASGTAAQLLQLLNQIEAPDENLASDIGRVRRQVERAVWLLANCDPYLAPQPALDIAQTHLVAAVEAANNFQSSQNVAYLGNVMANTDAVLVDLAPLAVPAEDISPAESIANLREMASEQMAGATTEMSNAVAQLQAKVVEVDQQRAAAEAQNLDLSARLDALRAEVEALRSSTTTLTTQWQSTFTDEQTARGDQFRTLLESQRTEGDARLAALDKTVKTTTAQVVADVRAVLDELAEQKATAESIVGIIADTALYGDASKRADQDKKAALLWSIGAVGLGLVAVVIALIAIAKHSSTDTDWIGFGLKALAVLAVGGVSAYAARQANEHRRGQRDLEHMAVQLGAIKHYLRDMDETKRDDVLKELSPTLFAPRSSSAPASSEALDPPPGTLQFVQMLVKALQAK